jgi:hypothetical protein
VSGSKGSENKMFNREDKENIDNQRLMHRLTAAANDSPNKSKMTSVMGKSVMGANT